MAQTRPTITPDVLLLGECLPQLLPLVTQVTSVTWP